VIYDIEKLLTDMKAVAVANLDTKLAAIAAEKGDGLTLATIPAAAYIFQTLTRNHATAYPAFMFYGYDDPTADGIGPYTLEEFEIFFIAMVKDTAENGVYLTRMMRYGRALKEIFQDGFNNTPWKNKLKVSSVAPVSFQIAGGPGSFMGAGVKVWTKI
jgi:hypothetical protein